MHKFNPMEKPNSPRENEENDSNEIGSSEKHTLKPLATNVENNSHYDGNVVITNRNSNRWKIDVNKYLSDLQNDVNQALAVINDHPY